MQNLAGKADADKVIEHELTRSRIEIVRGERGTGEVPYTITGKLGPITFKRAWYYWMTSGQIPLTIALQLYADPVGKTDIRVDGHCGCPPPEAPWVKYYSASGKKLISHAEYGKFQEYMKEGILDADALLKYEAADDPTTGTGYVENYHIDSEIGLRLFADSIRTCFALEKWLAEGAG